MGFLRRLLGGETSRAESTRPLDAAEIEAAEKAYELELLREDDERMSDLTRRQLRYADYAWTPPSQGDERRSEDRREEVEETPADLA